MAVQRPTPTPLDGLTDPSWHWTEPSRAAALAAFDTIAAHSDAHEETQRVSPPRPYKRGALLKLVHEHAPSPEAQDNVVQYFLTRLPPGAVPGCELAERLRAAERFRELGRDGGAHPVIVQRVAEMADALVDGFFVPFRDRGGQTPQPGSDRTPSTSTPPAEDGAAAGAARLRSLREACLVRDRHRCVISRAFDSHEANRRAAKAWRYDVTLDVLDDNNHALSGRENFDVLEVAHIIPPALLSSSSSSSSPDASTTYAQQVLAMLLPSLAASIEGDAIDQPGNALTLSHSLHVHFRQLDIYFVPMFSHCMVMSTKPFMPFSLPCTPALLHAPGIDAPILELLLLHRACCLILKASDDCVGYERRVDTRGALRGRGERRRSWDTAAEYIDEVQQEIDLPYAAPDGLTELGNVVRLRLLEESAE